MLTTLSSAETASSAAPHLATVRRCACCTGSVPACQACQPCSGGSAAQRCRGPSPSRFKLSLACHRRAALTRGGGGPANGKAPRLRRGRGGGTNTVHRRPGCMNNSGELPARIAFQPCKKPASLPKFLACGAPIILIGAPVRQTLPEHRKIPAVGEICSPALSTRRGPDRCAQEGGPRLRVLYGIQRIGRRLS